MICRLVRRLVWARSRQAAGWCDRHIPTALPAQVLSACAWLALALTLYLLWPRGAS